MLGLDYEPVAVEKARKEFNDKGLSFKQMNVMEINKLKQKFDLVVAFELIEHLDEKQQRELMRLVKGQLRPGGVVVISTPNRLVFSRGKTKSRYPYHKKELTVKELRALFKKEFEKVIVKGVKCKNVKEVKKREQLEKSLRHQWVDRLTGFKWVHWLMPMVPKKLKGWISGEGQLGELDDQDFKLVSKRV